MDTIGHALGIGFGLGFLVALQLGPMSLFLVRSTLRSGWRTGFAIGAGIACVDGLYAALGAAGAASLLRVEALRTALGLAGAVVLGWLAVRTLWSAFRVRAGHEVEGDTVSARRAFLTSLGATASNPLTIVSWAAIFAAASVGAGAPTGWLVAGVAAGSLTWVSALATVVALVGRAAGPRTIRVADTLAGLGMLGYAGALGWRTLHDR